jgi:hypothetical protein
MLIFQANCAAAKGRFRGFTAGALHGEIGENLPSHMAQFWIPKVIEGRPTWAVLPLLGSDYHFLETDPFLARADSNPVAACGRLARIKQEAAERWFLVLAPTARLWVNGRAPFLGAQVLADGDEVRLGAGLRLYFCTQKLPQVVCFPGAKHEIFCGRCRTPITKGTNAVACPSCGAWCHQTEELPCWNYPGTTTCPLCDQSNDLKAGFRWMPEPLTHENQP